MSDYTWPSVYFAYFFFAICFAAAVFFFVWSWKDGYLGRQGEDVKYRVFDDPQSLDRALRGSQEKEKPYVPR